jgi:hypothetical protein
MAWFGLPTRCAFWQLHKPSVESVEKVIFRKFAINKIK